MNLETEPYLQQLSRWPKTGRHIMAQFDNESIVVYQAYRPAIGHFAAQHGYFGGEFSLNRMSWIKPNFLWMMFRCGWALKEGQEVILAVRLQRSGFDQILAQAVPSSYQHGAYTNEAEWKKAVDTSDVRLQWDPDHDPAGRKIERRAIQLGLRGDVLRHYARDWIISIEDITPFVREQHAHVVTSNYEKLLTPREDVYPIADEQVAVRVGMARAD